MHIVEKVEQNTIKLIEWIGESGYKYDGYKYWIREYQTPLMYHNTYEEDYLNTEQLVQKYFDNHT